MANKLAIVRMQLRDGIRIIAGPGPIVADLELSDPAILRLESEFIADEASIVNRVFLTNGDILYVPEHNVLAVTLDVI